MTGPKALPSLWFLSLVVAPAALGQEPLQPTSLPQAAVGTTGLFATPAGVLEADGANYRARFDGAGATLRTSSPDADIAEVALTLRLADWGRAGGFSRATANGCERGGAALVCYEHDGLLERYRVGRHDIEQSFVLESRPAGHGDLVIGIAAAGDGVAAEARGAAHQALEFRGAGGAIRYGEAVAFERGGQPVEVATRYDGNGRIELVVPGAFLDAASYPVIVDPAVGPVLLPGGTSFNDSQADVAFDGATGHYLVVWTRTFSATSSDVRAHLYDQDGDPVGGLIAVTSGGQNRRPSVAATRLWNPDSFVIAFESGDRIRVAHRRASDGVILLPTIDATSPAAGVRDRRPSISSTQWPWSNAHLVWDRTAAGSSEPTQIVVAAVYADHPAVSLATGPEQVLEAVTGTDYVRNARLPQVLSLQNTALFSHLNRAVWERFYALPAPGDFDVRTATFKSSHYIITPLSGPLSVAGASSIGIDERLPAIAMQASSFYPDEPDYLIAWDEELDVHAARYNQTGAVGAEIDIRSTSDVETQPAVAAGDCEWTVGYLQAVPPNEFALNVRAARVLPDGTVAVTNRAVDVLNGPFQDGLHVASRPQRPLTSEHRNSVMFAWYGATGTAGTGLNDARARLFEPVLGTAHPFGVACPGPLGELPVIGTTGGYPVGGNAAFGFTIDGAPANSLAVLVVSDQFTTTAIPGAPGCNLYAGLPLLTLLPAVTDAAGQATVPLTFPCAVPSGASLAFQWAVMTPGWNPFGWIVSDDLDVLWSHN